MLPTGDVLVENGRIAAIAPSLEADAETIDCAGHFVLPGLINAHMHTWQTALRSVAANWTLLEYFRHVHAGLATVFVPDDIHIATLAGALNQLDHGVTTLVDWAHNNPTPEHTDAGIAGLKESGIRAAFFHGSPKPDPKPGEPHFSEVPHPRREIERLLKGPLADRNALVTLGMAVLGPHYSTLEVSAHDFALAREMGLVASMHQGGGEAKTPGGWETLMAQGLVGPHINIVHGNNLTDAQLKAFVDLGVSFSITPENEMAQGHGHPITGRLRALGSAPSVGVDLESAISGDMFTVARMALASQRALDNAAERISSGGIPPTSTVPASEALDWITTRGAAMLGMADRIGSLAPGKQADIAVMSLGPLAMWPVHDAVASLVMQGSGARVRDVLVAGSFAKRDGRLLRSDLGRGARQARGLGRTHPRPSRHQERQPADCRPMKTSRSTFMRLVMMAAAAVLAAAAAHAQTYPDKPIHVIVPFSPGSATDVTARALSQELSKKLGPTGRDRQPSRRRRHDRCGAGRQARRRTATRCWSTRPATPSIPRSSPISATTRRRTWWASACWPSCPMSWSCRRAGAGRPRPISSRRQRMRRAS